MDALSSLSESIAALARTASAKIFHVPSPAGGRTAIGFDGERLLVPASRAEEGERLELLAPGGTAVDAAVIGFSPKRGLAVLRLDAPLPDSAWKPMAGLPALGSLVLAAAYPSPEGPEARLDAVRIAADSYLQTDGSPFPGFSGCALVSPSGELAGFAVSDGPGNGAFALPAAKAKALVDEIVARGFPGRAWLGVSAIPAEARAAGADGEGRTVLLVAGLEPDGPAERAGAMVGDLIAKMGGKAIEGMEDFIAALDDAAPEKALAVSVIRGGKPVELSVVPARAPEKGSGHWKRHRRDGTGCGGPDLGPWDRFGHGPHGNRGSHGRGGHHGPCGHGDRPDGEEGKGDPWGCR